MLDSPTLKICHAQLLDICAGLHGLEPEKVNPKDRNSPAKSAALLKRVVSSGPISVNSLHMEALKQMGDGKEPKGTVLVGGDQGHSNAVYEVPANVLYHIVTDYKPAT